ncbi:hypothetical protein HYW76_05515 [Candidatus Pacearchaeota archaeon]|nr:hypothetical protein [Candidatus Pacearchaeota archaeon]
MGKAKEFTRQTYGFEIGTVLNGRFSEYYLETRICKETTTRTNPNPLLYPGHYSGRIFLTGVKPLLERKFDLGNLTSDEAEKITWEIHNRNLKKIRRALKKETYRWHLPEDFLEVPEL